MRRDYRDRPPRPWDGKGAGIWGNLSLSQDFEPKPKPGETTIKAVVNMPTQLANGMARRGHISYKQVEARDAVAIGYALLKAAEKEIYGGIKARRY